MRSRYGPLKRGETREDGKVFLQYEPRETKSRGRIGYERWVLLETYRKEQERQRVILSPRRKAWLAKTPGYHKRKNAEAQAAGRGYNDVYYAKHKEAIQKHHKDKYHSDPIYKMIILQRIRICGFLKVKNARKGSSSVQLLGCSPKELRNHLEKQFKPGMTWENHGQGKNKWQVDHIIPLNHFYKEHDLTDPATQKKAFHYTNLQPLWASENIAKSDKMISN